MNIKNFLRQERSTEAKIFEAVAGFLLLIMWLILLRFYLKAEGDIPIHFDLSGRPDGYGSPLWLLGIGVLATVTTASCLLTAYAPESKINMPFEITSPRQIMLTRRMVRVLAIEMCLLFIVLALMMGGTQGLDIGIFVLVGLMLVTIVYYCIVAAKAR